MITNKKIIHFYETHPNISFENVNLFLVEMLDRLIEQPTDTLSKSHLESILFKSEEKRQIDELTKFADKLREVIHQQIQYVSTKIIIAKTEYTQEFQTVISLLPTFTAIHIKDVLLQSNRTFIEKMRSVFFVLSKIRIANVANKTHIMIQQFENILNTNTESIISKLENPASVKEYADNFETNSTHITQAVIQLLLECLTSNELRIKQISELIKKGEDPKLTNYYKLIYDINDLLHQIPLINTVTENQDGLFEHLLSQTFPTASITSENTNEYLLSRTAKPIIYIETHRMVDRNINVSEVNSFLKRASSEKYNTHAILISQHSGIAGKPNYNVEIHNNVVVVYLHKMEYSNEKLLVAIDMIDALTSKLNDFFFLSENKYSIPKEILDNVNREYQQFIIQKDSIITILKDQHKRLIAQIEEMRFSSLDKYLATRYSSCKKQGFTCDLCNAFNVGTLKGLAAHKRGCARKIAALETETQYKKSSSFFTEKTENTPPDNNYIPVKSQL